jgi:mono/diheme cytochrome c family protein
LWQIRTSLRREQLSPEARRLYVLTRKRVVARVSRSLASLGAGGTQGGIMETHSEPTTRSGHSDTGSRRNARLRRRIAQFSLAAVLGGASLAMVFHGASADDQQVARGKYLVNLGSCIDCHTPGYFFGKPDMTKYLGGSDVGFAIPGLGVFVGPNLTPDKATGLGKWTAQQIATAITTGKTPEGRELAPIMPWHAYSSLAAADVQSIVAYLQSLPAVSHQVGGPYGPNEKPKEFVMIVIPPDVYSSLPPPPPPAK